MLTSLRPCSPSCNNAAGLIHHTDRECRYASDDSRRRGVRRGGQRNYGVARGGGYLIWTIVSTTEPHRIASPYLVSDAAASSARAPARMPTMP